MGWSITVCMVYVVYVPVLHARDPGSIPIHPHRIHDITITLFSKHYTDGETKIEYKIYM